MQADNGVNQRKQKWKKKYQPMTGERKQQKGTGDKETTW